MDIRLALMAGIDIPIPELQLTIHQPTIKEIALIGDTDFFIGIQCLTINKNMIAQGETLLGNTNNFQIFMTLMTEKESRDKKDSVLQVLTLIVPAYKISFTPRSMIMIGEQNTITIDENNFEALQSVLKEVFCIKSDNSQNFNPGNAKAKEIADKLMRARQRVAAQKGEDKGSVFVQYASALTVGLQSMSLQDCLNLTMFQMFDLIERYSLWLNWDLDIKSRLAGGKPEDKPDNWMKNIH